MKVDLEKLINKGFYRLPCDSTPLATSEATSGHKTVVILSPPRSCSSLVAGVLSKLGVFMGDKASSIVFEDTALAQHLEGGSSTSANALIENYNSRYSIWGFKRPGALGYIQHLLTRVRNPHLLLIFRDPLSTSLREHMAIKADLLEKMEQVLRMQQRMLDIVKSRQCPMLLLSAEKLRHYRADIVKELVSFLELNCTETQIQEAADFIELEPSRYLNEARLDRVFGHLEELDRSRITGWVRLASTEAPCKVIVRVNGAVRRSCIADTYRHDLFAKGIHSTGRCGFEIVLNDFERLTCDDHVEIRTEDDPATFLFAGRIGE